MAVDFHLSLDWLSQILPKTKANYFSELISFRCDTDLNGVDASARLRIRKQLSDELRERANLHFDLSDLTEPPQISPLFASISHTSVCGGYVISRTPIGFDIELSTRVSERALARIASDDEMLKLSDHKLSPAYLWTAKEAAFKAISSLKGEKLSVISQLQVGNWQKLSSQVETFSVLNLQNFSNRSGVGVSIEESGHTLSFFLVGP